MKVDKRDAMRRHPTIALARRLLRAPMLASSWSLESTDEAPPDAVEFLDKELQPWRTLVIRTAVTADVDYGWQPYEIVLEQVDSGNVGISKIKPLLQQLTTILVNKDTGEFEGFQQNANEGSEVNLTLAESLLISFEVEGSYWYGRARLEDSQRPYDDWLTISDCNNRYDRKLAGVHWIIHYPLGKSPFGEGGEEKDNYEIAKIILSALESSGGVVVPTTIADWVDSVNKDSPLAWKIELLGSSGSPQASFTDRMKYLDALMVRGIGLPERSLLEGQFGTKAEALAHADFAITDIEQTHYHICEQVTHQLINHLLEINYGPEYKDTITLVPSPISEARRTALKELYLKLLENPEILAMEVGRIDMDGLRDQVEVPFNSNSEGTDNGLDRLLEDGRVPATEPSSNSRGSSESNSLGGGEQDG